MTNTNCLENRRCPQCGDSGPFFVTASLRAEVLLGDDGVIEERDGDWEWEDSAPARCPQCGFAGVWDDFLDTGDEDAGDEDAGDEDAGDELIAAGYEWECPRCGHWNSEMAAVDSVRCARCRRVFDADPPAHVAHELMHQRGDMPGAPISRAAREQQAEAVAWVVARHFGVEGLQCANYIALHGGDAEQIRAACEAISACAREIIRAVEETGELPARPDEVEWEAAGLAA